VQNLSAQEVGALSLVNQLATTREQFGEGRSGMMADWVRRTAAGTGGSNRSSERAVTLFLVHGQMMVGEAVRR
jgi:hypothetical protein